MALLYGYQKIEKYWVLPVIILSTVSIFSQLNFFFDILITVIFLVTAVMLFDNDNFVLIFGVLLVFMPKLYLYSGGVSLINIFLLLYVFRMFYRKEKIVLNKATTLIIFLLYLYSIILLYNSNMDITLFVNYITSITLLMSLCGKLNDINLFRRFLITISISCVAAAIYGIFNANSASFYKELTTQILVQERFKGVASDPNYMAIIFIIGLFGAMLINSKFKLIKIILITILTFFTLTTQSTTALLSLLILLGLYIFMQNKITRFTFASIIVIILVFVMIISWDNLYFHLINSESFGSFANRVTSQINDFIQGNMTKIASGRVVIAQEYTRYFWKQNLFHIIFGGNLAGAYGMGNFAYSVFPGKYATHNTLLDILLSFGLSGLFIFMFVFIKTLLGAWKMYFLTSDIEYKILFILKIIVLIFSLSLSFFPSWTVLIFYLIEYKNIKYKAGEVNENIVYCK